MILVIWMSRAARSAEVGSCSRRASRRWMSLTASVDEEHDFLPEKAALEAATELVILVWSRSALTLLIHIHTRKQALAGYGYILLNKSCSPSRCCNHEVSGKPLHAKTTQPQNGHTPLHHDATTASRFCLSRELCKFVLKVECLDYLRLFSIRSYNTVCALSEGHNNVSQLYGICFSIVKNTTLKHYAYFSWKKCSQIQNILIWCYFRAIRIDFFDRVACIGLCDCSKTSIVIEEPLYWPDKILISKLYLLINLKSRLSKYWRK